MKKILISISLVLIIYSQSLAESSVWKIQKNNSVLFLGGTIHLLRPSDFPLPPEFEKAYKASDILILETDIGTFNDAAAQQKLMSQARYADGSTIDKHLSARTYKLLDEYCTSSDIPLAMLRQFKPSIIALTMMAVELTKLGIAQEGVDSFFYQLAVKDKKMIEGMETLDEQIHFIAEMGQGNEDAFITHILEDLKTIKKDYQTMVAAWKKGDVKKLDDLMVADVKTKMPKLYQELFTDRNKSWLPMITAYHETPEKEFILVGAGHLVGSDGIIEALRQKGYQVEKL